MNFVGGREMHQQIMQAAISNLSLGQGSAATRHLLNELADVTGLPVVALLSAKHRMLQLGNFEPLRVLLTSPDVPKATGLRYKIGIRQMQKGLPPGVRRAQACRLVLDFESVRGKLQIAIDFRVEEKSAKAQPQQIARLSMSYRLTKGQIRRTFRQAMTISVPSPRAGRQAKAA